MGGNIKGITIEFRGDTTKLETAISTVQKEAKGLDKELRAVQNALKFNPKNTELLAQKQDILKKKISNAEEQLKNFKQEEQALKDAGVDEQSAEWQKVRREIIQTESKIKHFNAELQKTANAKLTALGKSFVDVGKKMEKTGKGFSKYVTAPLAAAGGASIKVGMDFDAAMSQVAATMGTSVDQIQELRDFAIQMGSTTSFSATQAAEGLNFMALAGYSAEESMKMLPTVLNLAAAGGLELGAASDMVTDAQTALGLSMEETTDLVDKMAATSSKTNTSVGQLGEAILTVGGTARTMSGGTEELASVLGVLADNGVKGAEGGTALRNIILSLSAPTSKAAKTLDALGVSAYDADGNFKDLRELMPELGAALDGLSSEERAAALSSIFNKRDIKSVNALLNTSADRWDELGLALGDAGGAAEQMAETQLDNLKGSLTILKSALEGAAIAISDIVAPVIRSFANKLTAFVTWFNQQGPGTQKMIVALGIALAAIGPTLLAVGKAMQVVGNIMMYGPKVIGALSKALGFLAANPIVLIIAGIVALVAAFIYLWNTSEDFRKFWIALWTKIQTKVLSTVKAIKTFFVNLWTGIKAVWNGAVSFFTGLWNRIKGVFSGVKTWFANLFAGAWSAIKEKFAGWASFWSGLWSSVKYKFGSIGTSIAGAISGALKAGLNGVISQVENIINGGINLINGAISLANLLPGVNVGKLGRINLPRLAEGGVLRGAQTVIAGEAGPEAIIPLDRLFDEMHKMTEKMSGGTGGGIVVNVYGGNADAATIAQEVERRLIAAQKRRRLAWQ